MQFTLAVVAAATLSLANAAVQLTNGPATFNSGVTAGTPLEITWSGAEGPVTLTLKSGESTNLKTVEVIASGQTGTSYTWTPPTSLPDDTYALQIDDSTGTPNYSVQFAITGGAASTAPSSGYPTASVSTISGSHTGYPVSSHSSTPSLSYTTTPTGPSTTPVPTYSGNTTSTSSYSGTHTNGNSTRSSTPSGRSSSASSTSSSTGVPNSNSASSFASPLAFACLAFAAILTLN
ncbi:extracellular matrix protein [Diplocarpon rosae]|nr:extracellular matrix protein [Diplocarpon rosae]